MIKTHFHAHSGMLSISTYHPLKLSNVLINLNGGHAGRGECNKGDAMKYIEVELVGNADRSTHVM